MGVGVDSWPSPGSWTAEVDAADWLAPLDRNTDSLTVPVTAAVARFEGLDWDSADGSTSFLFLVFGGVVEAFLESSLAYET